MNIHSIPTIIILMSLTACSAFGVIESDNPAVKLQQAKQLFNTLDRPVPAERLIRESIAIYEKNDDAAGLAEAYRYYGFFFGSQSVTHWAHVYNPNGFLDKSATFNTRNDKSIEYFNLALAQWEKIGQHEWDSNIELNIATAYMRMNQNDNACRAYDLSLKADQKYHSEGKIDLPQGYSSVSEFIVALKQRVPCLT
jgi:tetratricopeptide (TPR) repeat protein